MRPWLWCCCVAAYRPQAGDFAAGALRARRDFRLEAYLEAGKWPEETHFDDLEPSAHLKIAF